MDDNRSFVIKARIERTVDALRKNQIEAFYIPDTTSLFMKINEYLRKDMNYSWGGSLTLLETGIISYLKDGGYKCWDRDGAGVDREEIHHNALNADVYFTSCNAITENGYIYNVDGNGNRIAAIAYGPNKVIVVAGYNKIVTDLKAARLRVRHIAGPANVRRIGGRAPCVNNGSCNDCNSSDSICSMELIVGPQMNRNRITVLLLPFEYGY